MATVTNQTEFRSAISSQDPDIVVANNISLTSPTTIGYTTKISGAAGVSLFWGNPTASNRNMLNITAAGALTIESLTLDAQGKDGTLVQVNGGSFTMNAGTVLKNVTSTTAQAIVKVGDITTRTGGTFTMNGGLITGMQGSNTVFIADAKMTMNNDATIDGNKAAGIVAIWSTLTMAGQSRISNNVSTQSGGGGLIAETTLLMGVREGDAPIIAGNSTPYGCGGLFLTNDSTLTMRYGAEISDNFSQTFAGGIGAQDTVISMRDNAAIRNNRTGGEACGMLLSKNTTATLEGNARVEGHATSGRGGGIYMQSGAILQMKGGACVCNNTAAEGAGIFLNASTASIGLEGTAPSVANNHASAKGGGVFISAGSSLFLTGRTVIRNNTAMAGNGIYKIGLLNLSGSPQILDGLYIDNSLADTIPAVQTVLEQLDVYATVILIDPIKIAETTKDGEFTVPTIVGALTNLARLQLEASPYISPANVPLLIAKKGDIYARLSRIDRAAWQLPEDFGQEYNVILNDGLDQALVVLQANRILYENLHGATNPNPSAYTAADLPLALQNPGERPGYTFTGWYNAEGQRITEIPVGTAGDIVITAAWTRLYLLFNGNAPCVSNVPGAVVVAPGEAIPVPATVPRRACYCFLGWNTMASGAGASYTPGGIVPIADGNVELFAQWRRIPNCCCR